MPVQKYCSIPFSLMIRPPKSIRSSSFGSIQLVNGDDLLCGIAGFKFFPISV